MTSDPLDAFVARIERRAAANARLVEPTAARADGRISGVTWDV